MKLEYLYPELGNLYGDSANMRYLRQCLPQAEYVETHIGETPAFVSDPEVCFVYSGPMTERGQGIALEELRPYAGALSEKLTGGLHGLFTGNSMELLGKSITAGETTLDGLGVVELHSRRDIAHRYNGLFLGNTEGIEITAFNSRFSHSVPGAGLQGFAKVTRGIGLDQGCAYEGYRARQRRAARLLHGSAPGLRSPSDRIPRPQDKARLILIRQTPLSAGQGSF